MVISCQRPPKKCMRSSSRVIFSFQFAILSVSISKIFFQDACTKGDLCTFAHGPEEIGAWGPKRNRSKPQCDLIPTSSNILQPLSSQGPHLGGATSILPGNSKSHRLWIGTHWREHREHPHGETHHLQVLGTGAQEGR